jgi:hypothetical protein
MKNVTVKDLKALLQEYPDDMLVGVSDHDNGFNPIDAMYTFRVEYAKGTFFNLQINDVTTNGGEIVEILVLE